MGKCCVSLYVFKKRKVRVPLGYLLFIYKPDTTHRVPTHHYFSTKRINLKFGIVVLLMLLMRNQKVKLS